MSTVGRHILAGFFISLSLILVLAVSYFSIFPLDEWSILWNVKIMDIPAVFFISGITLLIGSGIGVSAGLAWKKHLHQIHSALKQMEKGHSIQKIDPKISELSSIWKQIDQVQAYMTEQKKISQRLATQKAEEQEKRIQEIVSQERNRLARELHDSVSQQLFAASMLMSAINETNAEKRTPQEKKQLSLVEQMINQSQLEMRALLLHLRPAALKGKTLREGMKELLVELSQKVPIEVDWKLEDMTLDKGIEDHLFRILQESVSNTLRHAKASSLEVRLIQRESIVIMSVLDDGVGFVMEESKASSYGLQNMRERALEIGGTLKVISVPNKGTRLEVKVPIVHTEGEKDD